MPPIRMGLRRHKYSRWTVILSEAEHEMLDDLAFYFQNDRAAIFKAVLPFLHENMKAFEKAYPDVPGWTTLHNGKIDWLSDFDPARIEKRQASFRAIQARQEARLQAMINKGSESQEEK